MLLLCSYLQLIIPYVCKSSRTEPGWHSAAHFNSLYKDALTSKRNSKVVLGLLSKGMKSVQGQCQAREDHFAFLSQGRQNTFFQESKFGPDKSCSKQSPNTY